MCFSQMHPVSPNSFYIPINIFSFQLFCFKPMKLLVLKFYFSPKNKFDEM